MSLGVGVRGVFLLALTLLAARTHAGRPKNQIHRIVAVGDLHGDFSAWRDVARDAGLIDAAGRWIGGATVLVQEGDVVDRGPNSVGIVQDLMRLQKEASHSGGRVIALVGNHEAMNVTDDLRYNVPADYEAFRTPQSAALRDRAYAAARPEIEAAYRRAHPGASAEEARSAWIAQTPLGLIEHQSAWHPTGAIGAWVSRNPAVAELDGTLFVHGGISAAYACLSLDEINRRVDRALATRDAGPTSILFDPLGPLWYRGYAGRSSSDAGDTPGPKTPCRAAEPGTSPEDELTGVLAAYHARRMVIAHTPALAPIQILEDGRLIRTDTGMTEVYGGPLTWLEIVDGVPTPHVVARSKPLPPRGT